MNKRNILIITGFLILALPFGLRTALASPKPAPFQQASPLHPTFALLDSNGDNVLDTGNPVSTMQTCGHCHDTPAFVIHIADEIAQIHMTTLEQVQKITTDNAARLFGWGG